MNKISSFAIVVLTSFNFFANASIDKTPVVATVTGSQEGIVTVALLADGRLQLVDGSKNVITTTIDKEELKDLMADAKALSNIETVVLKKKIVCAMKPRPSLSELSIYSYDSKAKKFVLPPKLVLSASGCAKLVVTTPADPKLEVRARELRSNLVQIALDFKANKDKVAEKEEDEEVESAGKMVSRGKCLETAKSVAFEKGVTETQGNNPMVQKSAVLLESVTSKDEITMSYEVFIDNNNEDNEAWINVVKVDVHFDKNADVCVVDSAKVVRTQDVN